MARRLLERAFRYALSRFYHSRGAYYIFMPAYRWRRCATMPRGHASPFFDYFSPTFHCIFGLAFADQRDAPPRYAYARCQGA